MFNYLRKMKYNSFLWLISARAAIISVILLNTSSTSRNEAWWDIESLAGWGNIVIRRVWPPGLYRWSLKAPIGSGTGWLPPSVDTPWMGQSSSAEYLNSSFFFFNFMQWLIPSATWRSCQCAICVDAKYVVLVLGKYPLLVYSCRSNLCLCQGNAMWHVLSTMIIR